MQAAALISAMALALGVCISRGQVTNVSVIVPGGYSFLANPLSAGATNGANEIFNPIDGELILTWDGARFSQVGYDAGFLGWVSADGLTPTVPPSLPPGKGFVFFNPGAATTITFTGHVVAGLGETNVLTIPSGYSLLGSPLPARVTNITSAPVNLPLVDGMQILTWTGTDYDYSLYDSGFGGWVGTEFTPKQAPGYAIAQGFFYYNPGPPVQWQQPSP